MRIGNFDWSLPKPKPAPTSLIETAMAPPNVEPRYAPGQEPTPTLPYSLAEITPETAEPVWAKKLREYLENLTTLTEQRSAARQGNYVQQRDKEFQYLKEAYGIRGDTWETAEASDTVGSQNLQNFRDRWEKILSEDQYEKYNMATSYGGFAGTGDYGSLLNPAGANFKSGYIGG